MKLTDFKVLTFDCYGTLIDWESGILAGLKPLTDQLSPALTPDDILAAHALAESDQQAETPALPYSQLLAVVHARLAAEWGLRADSAACAAYGNSVADWPAFADSAETLGYLKRHFALVILSNIDNASFAASNRKLGVTFDAVFTAEDIGSYKPADRNFDYMTSRLGEQGFAKADILHTAESLYHDHIPAVRHGLATAWIHRRHTKSGFGATRVPDEMPEVDFRFESLAEMAATHARECQDAGE